MDECLYVYCQIVIVGELVAGADDVCVEFFVIKWMWRRASTFIWIFVVQKSNSKLSVINDTRRSNHLRERECVSHLREFGFVCATLHIEE